MSDHATLSPSAAERWFTCPGSVVLSEGLPQRTSSYAEEGTEAHRLAESLLNDIPRLTTVEMRRNVNVYIDHVRALAGTRHLEVKVRVTDDVHGTADAIVWRPDEKILYVRDLKYGAGIGVEVIDNLQLRIYALGALLTMKYPAHSVDVGIVQPRFPHPDGPIRSQVYMSADLIDFHADLMDAVKRVEEAQAKATKLITQAWQDRFLTPSEKGCRFCLAAPTCPMVNQLHKAVASQVFAPQSVYDVQALADTLKKLPILKAWMKNVEEFAYQEAANGVAIPGHKLVAKKANRAWSPDLVRHELAEMLKVELKDLLKPAEMITVTEAEKLALGANGKERASVLEPFVVRESSGFTLVADSDKRQAVSIDAKSVFGVLNDSLD